ncbi:MAG: N-acetylmuramoyl-L-alanine amidase [Armatimonadetes bacterium]|nr:N-acetylmuramoyl-L-alanine amidase [Armatimonadota bacterium]
MNYPKASTEWTAKAGGEFATFGLCTLHSREAQVQNGPFDLSRVYSSDASMVTYFPFDWIQSPNFGKRPATAEVDTIVIHSTVIPTLEATVAAFTRTSSQVSSHYVIGKDGHIVQCVSSFARAWHAGVSEDPTGRKNVNDFSVGIELVNLNDGKDPYPTAQVTALRYLILSLKRRFEFGQITSHANIARPLGRKTDPLGFPWPQLADLGIPLKP